MGLINSYFRADAICMGTKVCVTVCLYMRVYEREREMERDITSVMGKERKAI